jgi:hypothetical protein
MRFRREVWAMECAVALVCDVPEEELCEWCRMREVEEERVLVLGIGRLDLCGKCSQFFLPPTFGKG